MSNPGIGAWAAMAGSLSGHVRNGVLMALSLLLPVSARAAVTFAAPVDIRVGGSSQDVISANLNNDVYPDLVVCNTSSDSITVLLNDGFGGFSASTYSTGSKSQPVRSVIGDFNGDGINDIAVLHASGGTISVFLSTGTPGVYQTKPVTMKAGNLTSGIGAGDLVTGSNAPTDVVAVNQDTNNAVVMANSGSGGFSGPQAYDTGKMPRSVAVADFNGDGRPDLVTGNMATRNVSVLLGKGDRTFHGAKHSPTVDTTGLNIVPVKLAGSNHLDVVAPNNGKGGAIVLRGNGDGTFKAPEFLPGGSQSCIIAVGDLNRDGRPDLVTANSGSGDISIFMATADGGFEPAQMVPVVPSSSVYVNAVTVADLDNDGLDDIAVTLNTGTVRILTNTSVFVTAVRPENNPLSVGSFTVGSVTLSGKAPAGGAMVELSISDPSSPVVSVPPTILIPAGQSSATFDIVGRRAGTATLTATYNGIPKSVALTVTAGTTPPPPDRLNGDMDGDGLLTLNDVVKLLRIVGGQDDLGA